MGKKHGQRDKPKGSQEQTKPCEPTLAPLGTSSPKAEIPADNGGNDEESKNMALKTRVARFWNWITPNHVMAIFTVVIAVVAFFQWWVYRSQLDWMRIGERPWVAVKFLPIQIAVSEPLCSPLTVADTGRTPAKHIEALIAIRVLPVATPIDFGYPPFPKEAVAPVGSQWPVFNKFKIGVIFPNDPLPITNLCMLKGIRGGPPPKNDVWTQPMQDQFDRGETYVEAHGKFTYTDAIGTQHWTTFCETKMAVEGKEPSLEVANSCTAYNDVDDND